MYKIYIKTKGERPKVEKLAQNPIAQMPKQLWKNQPSL
jgi:hypothetical protein